MLQTVIAGVLVAFAAAYALWYWMPAPLRLRLGRVQKQLGEKPGCGACSSCSGCGTTAAKLPAEALYPATSSDAMVRQRQTLWLKPER